MCGEAFIAVYARGNRKSYTAKIGASPEPANSFVSAGIQQLLQYLPITLDVRGYAATWEGAAFPRSALIALNFLHSRRAPWCAQTP